MNLLIHLLALIEAIVADRTRVAVENVLLRQQITVLKRGVTRPQIDDSDRTFWVLAMQLLSNWKEHLVIATPETVIRWHRDGFGKYWKRKSRAGSGRPKVEPEIIELIRKLSKENVTWGAPRIQSELALLGHKIAQSTVAKYMVPREKRGLSQTWRTFLANHIAVSAACDFFTVPTLTFKVLYVFVVLSHDRQRIVHVNVTQQPTAEWTAQQIVEAYAGDGNEPRFLLRDRDAIYGDVFKKKMRALGIEEVISPIRSPWQNPYVERVIGSIRRECTDHIIAIGERHLLAVMKEYVAYYNRSRTHLSLKRNAPEPRTVEKTGDIVSEPVLGGLHHRYRCAA